MIQMTPIIDSMKLKQILNSLLEKNDMSIAQLSRKASVPKNNIHNWASGMKPKDLEQVKRVADTFGVTLDYLVFGIEIKKTNPLTEREDEINAGIYEIILRKPGKK